MSSPSVANIALQVRQCIENTCAQCQAPVLPTGEWTLRILTELTRLGRGYGFKVRGARPKEDDFEAGWLWDQTWADIRGWSKEDRSDGQLVNLPLVLESEWDISFEREILWDFQKLFIARADLRVMIFEQNTEKDAFQCLNRMKDAIKNFSATQIGDRYLLACWVIGKSRTIIEDYVH
jgi:hypothetical protein